MGDAAVNIWWSCLNPKKFIRKDRKYVDRLKNVNIWGMPRIERGASPMFILALFSAGSFDETRRENHTTRPHPRRLMGLSGA